MKILLADDERLALEALRRTVAEAVPDAELACFSMPGQVLEYMQENMADIALLDIEMGSTSGLLLAKMLKDANPDIRIIFVTGYDKYALEAFEIHASGYLMKPARLESVRRELTFAYESLPDGKKGNRVRVQTFGGFDIFVDEKLLQFRRSKSKELLAYLVDRRGVSITTREACAVLWEDALYDTSRKNYFQIVFMELRSTLRQAGIEYILKKSRNSLAVDPAAFSCDSYDFLNGDIRAVNRYRRDYMICYSWAEFSMGILEEHR